MTKLRGKKCKEPKITLVEVIKKKDISFKEVTEGMTLDKIKWSKEYMWLILANLSRINNQPKILGPRLCCCCMNFW